MAIVKLNAANGLTGTIPQGNITNASLNAVTALPFGTGITQTDNWRINTFLTGLSYPGGDITANWERADSTGQGANMVIGSGMTQSSGVFVP